MIVHLVAAGTAHWEIDLRSPVAEPDGPPGFWARRIAAARARWSEMVAQARKIGPADGLWPRWRAAVICHLDESLEEQRALRALRNAAAATLVHPSSMPRGEASAILDRILRHARRHHGRWLAIDTVLFAASGIFFLVPGPNLVAYYFAFRLLGHYFSWRGARQALDVVAWTFEAGS